MADAHLRQLIQDEIDEYVIPLLAHGLAVQERRLRADLPHIIDHTLELRARSMEASAELTRQREGMAQSHALIDFVADFGFGFHDALPGANSGFLPVNPCRAN